MQCLWRQLVDAFALFCHTRIHLFFASVHLARAKENVPNFAWDKTGMNVLETDTREHVPASHENASSSRDGVSASHGNTLSSCEPGSPSHENETFSCDAGMSPHGDEILQLELNR
jgi:hypothetical protein